MEGRVFIAAKISFTTLNKTKNGFLKNYVTIVNDYSL